MPSLFLKRANNYENRGNSKLSPSLPMPLRVKDVLEDDLVLYGAAACGSICSVNGLTFLVLHFQVLFMVFVGFVKVAPVYLWVVILFEVVWVLLFMFSFVPREWWEREKSLPFTRCKVVTFTMNWWLFKYAAINHCTGNCETMTGCCWSKLHLWVGTLHLGNFKAEHRTTSNRIVIR